MAPVVAPVTPAASAGPPSDGAVRLAGWGARFDGRQWMLPVLARGPEGHEVVLACAVDPRVVSGRTPRPITLQVVLVAGPRVAIAATLTGHAGVAVTLRATLDAAGSEGRLMLHTLGTQTRVTLMFFDVTDGGPLGVRAVGVDWRFRRAVDTGRRLAVAA